MPKSIVLHDSTVNTQGFRMLTTGCNLTELKRNPIGLLNHADWDMPIIRWENIRIEGDQILADPIFDEGDPKAMEVKRKYDNDFIRMASIGAWAPEEISDDPMLKLPGQTGPTVTKWTAREASIVTIGSNHNALAFYDRKTGNQIELTDANSLIKLMDKATKISKLENMNELNQILKLSDTATLAEQATAVKNLVSDRDRLKAENVTLSDQIDNLNKAAKEKKSAEAIALVDCAVKDGRLAATGKDNFIKLFDLDFDNAKATLEALPKRKSVTEQLNAEGDKDAIELADLQKKSWVELEKAGKLTMLRDKHYDVYAEKFKEKYGVEPKKA